MKSLYFFNEKIGGVMSFHHVYDLIMHNGSDLEKSTDATVERKFLKEEVSKYPELVEKCPFIGEETTMDGLVYRKLFLLGALKSVYTSERPMSIGKKSSHLSKLDFGVLCTLDTDRLLAIIVCSDGKICLDNLKTSFESYLKSPDCKSVRKDLVEVIYGEKRPTLRYPEITSERTFRLPLEDLIPEKKRSTMRKLLEFGNLGGSNIALRFYISFLTTTHLRSLFVKNFIKHLWTKKRFVNEEILFSAFCVPKLPKIYWLQCAGIYPPTKFKYFSPLQVFLYKHGEVFSHSSVYVSKFPKDNCAICLIQYESAVKLKCGHIFHAKCISEWLKNTKTCPMCRQPGEFV